MEEGAEELKAPIERISANVFFSYLGQLWSKVINLVLLPIIVVGLGNTSYGLYTFVIVLIGYYALLDLGISSAVIKYVSEYNAKGEYKEINRLVSTSLQAHFTLGTVGCLLIIFLARFVIKAVNIPPELEQTGRTVLYICAVQFLVNITGSVFSGILSGLQKIGTLNKISILLSTVTVSSIAILAKLGYGLVPIVLLNFFYNLLAVFGTAYFAKRAIPGLKLHLKSLDVSYLKNIVSFGIWTFVIQAGTLIHFTTDRILIGLFSPITYLTYYVVAVKLAEIIRTVPMPVVGVLFPAVSDLKAKGEESAIREIFFRGTKYVISLSIPISIVLFLFSGEILGFWMGPKFAESSSFVLMLFALGYFLNTITFINTSVLFGLGLHRLMAIYCIFSSSINLGLDILLIPRLGISGAATASLVAFLLTNPALVFHSMRVSKIDVRGLLRSVKKPLLSGVLAIFIAYGLKRFFPPTGVLELILSAALVVTVYYAFLLLAGGFDERDRYLFKKFIEVSLKSTPLRCLIERREIL